MPHEQYAERARLFHLVVRSHPAIRRWDQPLGESIWRELMAERSRAHLTLVAACLMPDHVHLVASPGVLDLIRWVNAWKSFTTHRAWEAGHRGPLWQPSFWDRAVRAGEAMATVEYVVLNPVVAGLVDEWTDWPWTFVASESAWQ